MASAVTRIRPRQYRVDFARLRRVSLPLFKKVFGNRQQIEVDPFLIAQAVKATMKLCEVRSVHGRPLVWNEYRIFLASRDYQGLVPLVAQLRAGLDTVIRSTLDELRADTVGDPVVRILIDEQHEVPQAVGDILVEFVEDKALDAPLDGEVTVRVARSGPPSAPVDESTQRIPEPPGMGALCLSWHGNEVPIAPESKVLVGRPHPNPPENFVPLLGASQRINSRQLAVENAREGVVITRLANANPVQVGGRLIQSGGKLSVSELPAEISLSNGEMVLRLKACDS